MPQLRWGGTMGAGSAPSFSSSLGTSCSLTAEHIQLRFSHPRITHTLQPHSSLTHWTSHTNRSPAGPAGPCTRGRSTPSLPLSLSLTPLCHTVSANSACSARIQQLGSLGSPCTTATTTSAGKNSSRMYSSRSRTSISNRMFVASSTSRISSGSSSALLTRIPLTSSRSLHPRTPTALPSLGNHPSQAQSNTPRSNPRSTLRSTPWSPLGPATRLTPRSTPGARPAVHVRGLQQNAKGGSTPGTSGEGDSGAPSTVQILFRKTVRNLASLPLAIGLLFAIAGTCALGTVIEQGASPAQYLQDYPLEKPILGFLTGDVILTFGLDHVYTNPVFLGMLALLAACLSACTSTRQLPMLRVARRWSFLGRASSIQNLEFSEAVPSARLADVGVELKRKGYEVFKEGEKLYGFKGLAGRLAPIGVHAAMLLVMLGGTYSALGGFQGSAMIPQGLQVLVSDTLVGNSFLARPTSNMNMVVQLDRFYIDYRPNGEVKQFYSDLTLLDYAGRVIQQKTISVNDPLRAQGVTMYQTDWAISALQLRVDGKESFNLPFAALADPNGSSAKLFGTFLPFPGTAAEGAKPRGVTFLARDLQSVVLYDSDGNFVGVRRPGSKKAIKVNDISIVIDDIIGSSGLEMKADPGVPLVYTGFGALMLTSFISYLSHSQVWALQEGSTVHLGGKTNRAKYSFQDELNEIVDSIPEVKSVEPTPEVKTVEETKEAAEAVGKST